MKDEYIIINKTKFLKIREELEKGSPHWDGIYISDYQMGQIDLIDNIITSQSTPLIPEIEKSFDAGELYGREDMQITIGRLSDYTSKGPDKQGPDKQDYTSNLKLDI